MKNIKNVLWGLFLIASGVFLALDIFEVIDIRFFADGWWTMFIIVPCTIDLFERENKIFDIIGIVIGVILLLTCQEVLTLKVLAKLIVPVILIVAGVIVMFSRTENKAVAQQINHLNQVMANRKTLEVSFERKTVEAEEGDYLGPTNLAASFGSLACDFSKATIANDIVINANARFGVIDICLPPDTNVVVASKAFFGGTSNTAATNALSLNKTVYINSSTIFGKVNIM